MLNVSAERENFTSPFSQHWLMRTLMLWRNVIGVINSMWSTSGTGLWTHDQVVVIVQRKLEASEYHKLITQRLKEQRERRSESIAKKRAIRMASQASKEQTS